MMALAGLILVLAGQPWSAEAAASQARIFQSAQWTTTTHLAAIAAPVVTQLHQRVAARIADHGGAFNPTDVQAGADDARFRLVLAGHSGDHWFVCLEVGGFAHILYLTMFDVTKESARLVLFALGNAKHSESAEGWTVDVTELKNAFREKSLNPVDPTPYLIRE